MRHPLEAERSGRLWRWSCPTPRVRCARGTPSQRAWSRAILKLEGARVRLSRRVGKEKGFALSPIRAREMRRFLERNGYEVVPGHHKHLKLRHDYRGDVLLPLRPGDNLSYVAIKQIAAALGIPPEELIRQAR